MGFLVILKKSIGLCQFSIIVWLGRRTDAVGSFWGGRFEDSGHKFELSDCFCHKTFFLLGFELLAIFFKLRCFQIIRLHVSNHINNVRWLEDRIHFLEKGIFDYLHFYSEVVTNSMKKSSSWEGWRIFWHFVVIIPFYMRVDNRLVKFLSLSALHKHQIQKVN